MFYFVAAWYDKERPWYQEAPDWYHSYDSMTFDDTVNHLKMCQKAKEDASLLILNYQPQLRYFLHKQGLLSSSYWSFFDDVQSISGKYTKRIDFKSLNWPSGTTFSYNPYMVVAHQEGRLLANINFGENGNVLTIQFFAGQFRTKRFIFDDRGFLSSILYFEENQPAYQDYLNQKGQWQVREDFRQFGCIQINPLADKTFRETSYRSWGDLLQERLQAFKQGRFTGQERLVIASHSFHNALLTRAFPDEVKVFSFYGERFDMTQLEELALVCQEAKLLVMADLGMETKLLEMAKQAGLSLPSLSRLSPFDTRLRLGRSQTIKELIICFFVDGLSDDDYQLAMTYLLEVMVSHPLVSLKVLSYDEHFDIECLKGQLITRIKADYEVERFMVADKTLAENQLAEEQSWVLSAVSFERLTNENQLITVLDTARLVLDLGDEPDTYTQIASLSAGIPQVNRFRSDYVNHGENGWIVSSFNELPAVCSYYFEGLTNWNKSLVHTVQKMGDYTSGRIIEQWKVLLEE